MSKILSLLAPSILLIYCCTSPTPREESPASVAASFKGADFVCRYDCSLYGRPGKNTLQNLQQVDSLRSLNGVKGPIQSIIWEDTTLFAPWVEVETAWGQQGWVHGSQLQALQPGTGWSDWCWESMLGSPLFYRISDWSNQLDTLAAATSLAQWFQKGDESRRQWLEISKNAMKRIPARLQSQLAQPEHTPFGNALILHVDKNQEWQLFWHYPTLLKAARRTPALMDDRFFEWQLQLYPIDSTEYHYTDLILEDPQQLEPYHFIGDGRLYRWLQLCQQEIHQQHAFSSTYAKLQSKLLQPLSNFPLYCWLEKEKVVHEIDSLLSLPKNYLLKEEWVALQQLQLAVDSATADFPVYFNGKKGGFSDSNSVH